METLPPIAAADTRFRSLFEHTPELVLYQNEASTILDANPAFLKLVEKPKDQVLNHPYDEFLPPDMRGFFREKLREVFATGQPVHFEMFASQGKSAPRHWDVMKIPLVEDGRVVGVHMLARDITEKAAAQRLNEQQAARLHQVLESITDAFLSMDKDGKLTYLNREGERLLNLRHEDALGKNMWALFPEEAGSIYRQQYQQALDTGDTVHFEAYFARERRWLDLKVYPFAEGVSIFFADITKRVASDQQLKLLALVAEGTVNGVVIAGADGRTEWVNAGFTRHTGYALADVVGRKCGHVLQGPETDPAAVRRFQEGLQQDQPFSVTLLNYTKTGEKLWLAVDVTPIYTYAGELMQFIALQQNITPRKEAEARQARMTQELYRHNRDLQQFTYVISHNLRGPLSNALGLAALLPKLDPQQPVFATSLAYLRASMAQADTVLQDLNRMLSLRDQPHAPPERVALADVCRQAVADLAEPVQQCGGQVRIAVPDNLAVRGNRAYVYSMFHNLLSNSLKYRAPQRPLRVDIAGGPHEGGTLTLSFADNGSGFDRAKAGADVFQLYKRFHPQQPGRGLGLFLVKTHVEAMGGTIEVSSAVEQGTRFVIRLETY
jgi:PAS domain S-box-containing protein